MCPDMGAGVEGIYVVWVGSPFCFAAVDDDDVASPEGGGVAAAFVGRRGRGCWEGGYEGPFEDFEIEAVDVVEDCPTLASNVQMEEKGRGRERQERERSN